jgi:hypothetical protein
LRNYGVETCLLDRGDGLVTALLASPEWRQIYSDNTSTILARQSAAPVNAATLTSAQSSAASK